MSPLRGVRRFLPPLLLPLLLATARKTYQQQPFDRQAFEILQLTDQGVAAAEKVFNVLVTAGKVSQHDRDLAASLHEKYVSAYRLAILALGGTLEDQQAAMNYVAQAAAELLRFINTFKGVT